jgi:transposase InsO family protein
VQRLLRSLRAQPFISADASSRASGDVASSPEARESSAAAPSSVPAEWSRARQWKFRQLLQNYVWRVGTRMRDRWSVAPRAAPEPGSPAATAAAAAAAAVATAPAAANAGGVHEHPSDSDDATRHSDEASNDEESAEDTDGSDKESDDGAEDSGKVADARGGAGQEDVLEVLLPDPSADGRVLPALKWLEVVPAEDVGRALHALYVDPAAGASRGAAALYEQCLQRYVGIHMRDVKLFLERQETKQAVHPKQGYLITQPTVTDAPGLEWEVDVAMVSLPTASANRLFVGVIDTFSRFAWAAPLDTNHGSKVAAALQTLMLVEGAPQRLRSDNGGDVSNADTARVCARFGVARKLCRPHNSQCNGMIERWNRTIKEALTRQVHEWSNTEFAADWVALMPSVVHAYNCSVHRATGFTPYLLQRGRAPRALGPLQLQLRSGAGADDGAANAAETACAAAPRAGAGTGRGAGPRWHDAPEQTLDTGDETADVDATTRPTPAAAPALQLHAAAASTPTSSAARRAAAALAQRATQNALHAQAQGPVRAAAPRSPARRRGRSRSRRASATANALPPSEPLAAAVGANARVAAGPAPAAAAAAAAGPAPAAAAAAAAGPAPAAAAAAAGRAAGDAPLAAEAPEYGVARVLATRRDPRRKETRYWVRWAGYGPQADSWIPARLAGDSEKQFERWITQTHRLFPPLALSGPFVTPAGLADAEVPVTAADRAALRAAEAARDMQDRDTST